LTGYVTHDQEEALAVSDEIVVMRNAEIAQIGPPRALYDAPADTFVADFIGDANLLDCEILAVEGGAAEIAVAGVRHHLPSRGLKPGKAKLAIRPSRARIVLDAGLPATVDKVTYVGPRMEYTFRGDFGLIFAVSDNVDAPYEPGQAVRIGLAESGPVLVPDA
jgi:iron(III) transport system ATP-binding protein